MTLPRTSRLRALALSAAVAGAAGIAAPVVQAAPVTAGDLTWSSANVFAGAERTWLGYTSTLAGGGAAPSAGATGDTVTPASPKGADQIFSWTYGGATGSYEPADGTGTIQYNGVVTFDGPAHGIVISVENPKLVLNGDSGQLFASGTSTNAARSYDASTALFNLDLTHANVTLRANGTRTISGIVPSLASEDTAFPGTYRIGAGPDRTPNTFGAFTFNVRTAPVAGPKGDKGDSGAKGDKGDTGVAGKDGKDGKTVYIQTAALRSAPFKGKAARKIRVTARKSTKVLATGTVKGRTLKVTLKGKKALKGSYLLRVVGGKATATVRIP
jgi:hypothetical protein